MSFTCNQSEIHVFQEAFNLYTPHCCIALSLRQEGFRFLDIKLCIVIYAAPDVCNSKVSVEFENKMLSHLLLSFNESYICRFAMQSSHK